MRPSNSMQPRPVMTHGRSCIPKPPAELDFLSPSFSAEQALFSSPSRIQLPCPDVQPCDNLEQYSSLVQGSSSRRVVSPSLHRAVQPEEKEERTSVVVERRAKSVLSFMETPQLGPLSMVQHCRAEGVRVKVVVRHCAGVRGECEGSLLAFDKHLNIVLGSVHEKYTPIRTVANGGVESKAHRKRKRHKTATHMLEGGRNDHGSKVEGHGSREVPQLCRQLDKLFIRGDNVVLISPISDHI